VEIIDFWFYASSVSDSMDNKPCRCSDTCLISRRAVPAQMRSHSHKHDPSAAEIVTHQQLFGLLIVPHFDRKRSSGARGQAEGWSCNLRDPPKVQLEGQLPYTSPLVVLKRTKLRRPKVVRPGMLPRVQYCCKLFLIRESWNPIFQLKPQCQCWGLHLHRHCSHARMHDKS
jgi:hypothetical protein